MLRHSWWLVFIVGLFASKVTFAARITDYVPLTDPSDNALTYFYDPDKAVGWQDRTVSINVLRDILITGTYVPTSRTINSYSLLNNITLSASDVGAVPTTRTINGYGLSSNITLVPADIGLGNLTNEAQMPLSYLDTDTSMTADSNTRVPSQAAVRDYISANVTAPAWGSITGTLSFQTDLNTALSSKVPTTRTINGYVLSSNVSLSASDVGLGSVTNTAQMPLSYLDTDAAMAANSNTKVPSQAAVVSYVLNNLTNPTWGNIGGTLANQTDLNSALAAKMSLTNLPSLSVDGELALFSGVSGKVLKRATGTGIVRVDSGVATTTSDGSGLTLNATNLTSGLVPAARLSSSILNTVYGYTPMNSTAFSGTSKITVGTTQPTSPTAGDIWLDTTGL